MDHLSPERRSWLMSQVRSKDTSAEIRVRKFAHSLGLRFRLHRRDLPGNPDLVFPRHRLIIFVNGCFWHRHPGCSKASIPKSNIELWTKKFTRNIERDAFAKIALESQGWKVETIWECQTKDEANLVLFFEKLRIKS
jgi:DNA mismatch endonuclease, patch repair protein